MRGVKKDRYIGLKKFKNNHYYKYKLQIMIETVLDIRTFYEKYYLCVAHEPSNKIECLGFKDFSEAQQYYKKNQDHFLENHNSKIIRINNNYCNYVNKKVLDSYFRNINTGVDIVKDFTLIQKK